MKCAIIAVIAGSEVGAYARCSSYIKSAIATSLGPFSVVEEMPIFASYDDQGTVVSKTAGVERAIASGFDWVFFIRPIELMSPEAFGSVVGLVQEYDAIWGLACEATHVDLNDANLSANQMLQINSIYQIFGHNLELQTESGFFIRSQIALELFRASLAVSQNDPLGMDSRFKTVKCTKGNFILSIQIKEPCLTEQDRLRGMTMRSATEQGKNDAPPTLVSVELDLRETLEKDEFFFFSIGTLVTNRADYDEMLASFEAKGFSNLNCEFIYIDNSESNKFDAFSGLNRIIHNAKGKYIILCHQDIRLHDDDFYSLVDRLSELNIYDPHWALAGNAGGSTEGAKSTRITDPHGEFRNGPFPARVFSLDENFIIIRCERRVSFSHDLRGFHFYGTDICLNADILGYSAYVINFHLLHLSGGNLDKDFFEAKKAFELKWSRAIRSRTIQTTCTIVDIEHLSAIEAETPQNLAGAKHINQIYQIFYDHKSRELVSPLFLPLDNTENLRPDWYEFWPIRKSVAKIQMHENAFYGFLSPNFSLKTGYSPAEVLDTVKSISDHIDVILLTPNVAELVCYTNPFIQGETWHPGLMNVCEVFFKKVDSEINLKQLVTTLDNSVYSNYILANPRFWRNWSKIADQLFDYAEDPESELFDALNVPTNYKEERNVQMKVFVQERIATFLLANGEYNTFVPSHFKKLKMHDNEVRAFLVYLENLKNAYRKSGNSLFLSEFHNVLKTGTLKVSGSIHNLRHITK